MVYNFLRGDRDQPFLLPCRCQIFGLLMRPAHTHGSARQVDLAA